MAINLQHTHNSQEPKRGRQKQKNQQHSNDSLE